MPKHAQPTQPSGLPLLWLRLKEWNEVRSGNRDRLTPSRRLLDEAGIGSGDYDTTGKLYLGYFKDLCGIKPDSTILDIGCGYGRMAKPFTEFLDPAAGKYVGWDVFPKSVAWCQRAFGRRHPNFQFECLDIYNKHYNESGTESDTSIRFPHDDGSFDLIFLTSVFTHLMPPAIDHYLSEIARLLKPGGKCLGTYFLLDDESRALIAEQKTQVHFKYTHPDEGWMALREDDPERCIGFPEEVIYGLIEKNQLEIEQPVRKGRWCEREETFCFQDIIICHRKDGATD